MQRTALQAWAMLSTKQGSIDWAGLPVVSALLGVVDVELLVQHLMTIKFHNPNRDQD